MGGLCVFGKNTQTPLFFASLRLLRLHSPETRLLPAPSGVISIEQLPTTAQVAGQAEWVAAWPASMTSDSAGVKCCANQGNGGLVYGIA